MSAYEHMAVHVVEAALDRPPATFAIHGHALVAAQPPFLVMEMARALELTVEVLPGISSLDSLFADFRLDPVVHGIEMYEATGLPLRKRPLQSDVPAILWQIGPIETALHSQRASRPEHFERFVAHLMRYYAAPHQVTAIYCAAEACEAARMVHFAIQDIPEHAAEIHAGFTLYVPPAAARALVGRQLAAQLYNPAHLRKIAE